VACVSFGRLTVQTLSGDTGWQPTLDFALRHVARRGGAAALLAEPDQSCDRRFLIEQIAVADLFSKPTGHPVSLQIAHL
jgi:hypothetical protein